MRALLVVPLLAVVLPMLGASSGCGPACRDTTIQPIDLVCEESSDFSGELHVDSAATFDTFVTQQCAPGLDAEAAAAIVESVDFSQSGVFVAKGPNGSSDARCIVEREVERAQVCEDGLKVYFRDRTTNDDPTCTGSWTVAFTLPREDLRAVLAIQ